MATVGTVVVGNGSVVIISVVGFVVDTEQHMMVTWSSKLVCISQSTSIQTKIFCSSGDIHFLFTAGASACCGPEARDGV